MLAEYVIQNHENYHNFEANYTLLMGIFYHVFNRNYGLVGYSSGIIQVMTIYTIVVFVYQINEHLDTYILASFHIKVCKKWGW